MMSKKSITLINMNPPYEMKATTLMMAAPHCTTGVQQVLVYETEIRIRDLVAGAAVETNKPLSVASFDAIYADSHTVVIPDAMFTEKSKVFKSEAFVKHGMEALGSFQKAGGNVIVFCVEGTLVIGDTLNRLFGTKWKIKFFESAAVEATDLAMATFGRFLPMQAHLKDGSYFIDCPNKEGLYRRIMNDKKTFDENFRAEDATFEKLGIEKDETMDCFNIEKSWENYVSKYTNRYCIALHQGRYMEGHVVWYGDRGQSDTMAYLFCKMLNLGSVSPDPSDTVKTKSKEKNGLDLAILLPLVAIIVAVLTRYINSK
jgi:hypothetical protein